MRATAFMTPLIAASLFVAAQAKATPQVDRGRLVKELYTPVRALSALRSGYMAQIRQMKHERATALERVAKIDQQHPSVWLSKDPKLAAVKGEHDRLLRRSNELRSELIPKSETALRAVQGARRDLAGVIKNALRDGTRELRDPNGVHRAGLSASGRMRGVAKAVITSDDGRLGLVVRHTPGRARATTMPGFGHISLNQAVVEMGKTQLMVALSGHFSEWGARTTIVKTFDLRPRTEGGYAINQVRAKVR